MFGDRLKQLRSKKGWSQNELADLMGVTTTSVQGYERGASIPGGKALGALAELGLNISWLLTGKKDTDIKKTPGSAYIAGEGIAKYNGGAGAARGPDAGLLKDVIRAIAEELRDSDKMLEPEKFAELVVLLYEVIEEEEGGAGSARVAKMIKLVVS